MKKSTTKREVKILGIDLAKKSFYLHGVDKAGETVLKKKMTRNKLKEFIIQLPPCLMGIEACGGSHYWKRFFEFYGHQVKMIAPQFVKPYVKSNKNDAVDAEAICEAVQRPSMRFVPGKSIEQQDQQSIHRIRSQLVAGRTAQSNQIRGLLLEYGITIPKGISYVRKYIPQILENADNELSDLFRELLLELYEEMKHFDERIQTLESKLEALSKQDENCQRLLSIPGIGLLTSTALIAAIGDISAFKSGRELAAWIGLVPKQHSTGGKSTLLGISKRGDSYLRTLLIHGGRSVVRSADKHKDRKSGWVSELAERRGNNIASVAVANKNARIAWAILSHKTTYKVEPIAS